MSTKVNKALTWIQEAWLILGITFVLFLFIEIVLSLAFHFRDMRKAVVTTQDFRISADVYQNNNWAEEYYKEFKQASQMRWSPYVYWRNKAFQGKYINVDSNGIRKSWRAVDSIENEYRPLIFFFGGSTMWGTGARDEFTIPSMVAKQLASQGINADVINFGESGYVSTQEVILLIRELQKGNRPDLAVFLDGTNDTYAAYQQKRAGLPQNEFNRVKEFNTSKRKLETNNLLSGINNLATIRFSRGVLRRMGFGSHSENVAQHTGDEGSKLSSSEMKTLSSNVLDIYTKNLDIINGIAKRDSFEVLFYWQPTLFEKKKQTKYEETEKQRFLEMQSFFDVTYGLAKQRDFTRNDDIPFHDISNIFSDTEEAIYVDWCHQGEKGNLYIAEKIVRDALPFLTGSAR